MYVVVWRAEGTPSSLRGKMDTQASGSRGSNSEQAVCGLVSCCAWLSCHPRETRLEGSAGSSCTMRPWVRDDCGHELNSPLLL